MAKSGVDLEAELDDVYRSPLSGFIAARDALAARLKSSGNVGAAGRVKALKKPSVPAWAVNQIRFGAPTILAELLAAGDRLRSRSPDAAKILESRKAALAAARGKTEDILTASGHAQTPETMRRVSATLEALATYGTSPGRPLAGRLTEELPAPGFDDLAALGILPGAAAVKAQVERPKPSPAPAAPRRDLASEARALKTASRAKELRERAETKKKEAERAQASLLEAEGRADTLRRKREELEKALAEARRYERAHAETLAGARAAARAAERAARLPSRPGRRRKRLDKTSRF